MPLHVLIELGQTMLFCTMSFVASGLPTLIVTWSSEAVPRIPIAVLNTRTFRSVA